MFLWNTSKSRRLTSTFFPITLTQPHPLYRSLGDELNCASICAKPRPAQGFCASDLWTPNYQKKQGCECLIDYRCCPKNCTSQNAKVDVKSCWGDDLRNKGKRFCQWTSERMELKYHIYADISKNSNFYKFYIKKEHLKNLLCVISTLFPCIL